MSDDLRSNFVNDLSDLSSEHVQERLEISPWITGGHGWFTLTVSHSNHYMDDCLVEAHIRRRTLKGHRADLCAVFDFPAARRDELKISLGDRGVRVAKIHANLGCDYTFDSERKEFVFVPIGEFTQDAEQWGQIGVWSVVRLIPLNRCPHWIANSSELLSANDGIIKVRPIIGDGELEPTFVAGRFRKRFVAGYRIYEMIQAATEGVDTVGDDQGPIIERRGLINPNDDSATGAISIHLLKYAIRISFHPGRDFIADGLSMFRAVS